jgi:hypothetical protein
MTLRGIQVMPSPILLAWLSIGPVGTAAMQSLYFPRSSWLRIDLWRQGPAIHWLGAGKEAAGTASSLFLEASQP